MRIGVISDTHGLLRPRVFDLFEGVDHILHAGDICDDSTLDALAAVAPVTAVAGNNDGFRCAGAGAEARVTLGGLRIYMTHMIGRPGRPSPPVAGVLAGDPVDLVVFGHSHLPHDERIDGVWFFNPGSAGPRRFDYPVTVGFLEADRAGTWHGRHAGLDPASVRALRSPLWRNRLSRGF